MKIWGRKTTGLMSNCSMVAGLPELDDAFKAPSPSVSPSSFHVEINDCLQSFNTVINPASLENAELDF